jgi:hypothetical protein
MKKSILFASAALAALAFTSCSNEVDMFQTIGSEKATIDLNVSNDVQMSTRAGTAIAEADYAKWFVKVSPNAAGAKPGETAATGWLVASTISSQSFKPGDYTITVANYREEGDAYTTTNPYGDAYYTKSVDQTLLKGPNAVVVDCDKAENCRVKVDFSGLSDVTTISNPDVTLSQAGRGFTTTNTTDVVACPALTNGEIGYFMAGTAITYQLNYTYKSNPADPSTAVTKHSDVVTISAPAKHTEYLIVATSNSNGTITLTIKCSGEFDPVSQPTITIDAATGTIS